MVNKKRMMRSYPQLGTQSLWKELVLILSEYGGKRKNWCSFGFFGWTETKGFLKMWGRFVVCISILGILMGNSFFGIQGLAFSVIFSNWSGVLVQFLYFEQFFVGFVCAFPVVHFVQWISYPLLQCCVHPLLFLIKFRFL